MTHLPAQSWPLGPGSQSLSPSCSLQVGCWAPFLHAPSGFAIWSSPGSLKKDVFSVALSAASIAEPSSSYPEPPCPLAGTESREDEAIRPLPLYMLQEPCHLLGPPPHSLPAVRPHRTTAGGVARGGGAVGSVLGPTPIPGAAATLASLACVSPQGRGPSQSCIALCISDLVPSTCECPECECSWEAPCQPGEHWAPR